MLSLGSYGVSLVLLMALLPIFIGVLGARNYGAWVVTGGVVNYIAMFDFGFGLALVRFVARDRHSDPLAARGAIASGAVAMAAVALVLCAVTFAVSAAWESHLGIGDAAFALRAAGLALLFVLPAKAAQSAYEGGGAVGQSRVAQAVLSTAFLVGAIACAATFERPMRALGLFLLVHSALGAIVYWGLLWRAWAGQSPLAVPSRARLREVTTYALGAQGAALLSTAVDPVSRFVLAAAAGPSSVAALDVALRTRAQWFAAAQAFLRPLIPALARLGTRGADEMARTLKAFERTAVGVALVAVGSILLSYPWLFAVSGEQTSALAAVAVTLWVPATIAGVPYTFIVLHGAARDIVKIQLAVSLVTLLIVSAGVLVIGAWGPVVGAGVGSLAGVFVIHAVLRRLAPTGLAPAAVARRAAVVAVAATAVYVLASTAPLVGGAVALGAGGTWLAHQRRHAISLLDATRAW